MLLEEQKMLLEEHQNAPRVSKSDPRGTSICSSRSKKESSRSKKESSRSKKESSYTKNNVSRKRAETLKIDRNSEKFAVQTIQEPKPQDNTTTIVCCGYSVKLLGVMREVGRYLLPRVALRLLGVIHVHLLRRSFSSFI